MVYCQLNWVSRKYQPSGIELSGTEPSMVDSFWLGGFINLPGLLRILNATIMGIRFSTKQYTGMTEIEHCLSARLCTNLFAWLLSFISQLCQTVHILWVSGSTHTIHQLGNQACRPSHLFYCRYQNPKEQKPTSQAKKSSKTCHINAHLYLGLFENGGFIPNIRPSNRRENPWLADFGVPQWPSRFRSTEV